MSVIYKVLSVALPVLRSEDVLEDHHIDLEITDL